MFIFVKGDLRGWVRLNPFPAVELALRRRSPAFTPGSLVISRMPRDRVTLTGPESRSDP